MIEIYKQAKKCSDLKRLIGHLVEKKSVIDSFLSRREPGGLPSTDLDDVLIYFLNGYFVNDTKVEFTHKGRDYFRKDQFVLELRDWDSVLTWIYKNKDECELELKKYKSRLRFSVEVGKGTLKRPEVCQICGKTGRKIVGHHQDYSKPLDVVWCCHSCHQYIHSGKIKHLTAA